MHCSLFSVSHILRILKKYSMWQFSNQKQILSPSHLMPKSQVSVVFKWLPVWRESRWTLGESWREPPLGGAVSVTVTEGDRVHVTVRTVRLGTERGEGGRWPAPSLATPCRSSETLFVGGGGVRIKAGSPGKKRCKNAKMRKKHKNV